MKELGLEGAPQLSCVDCIGRLGEICRDEDRSGL